ncbi:F0F1 ATP synthase subunit B [Roseiterribacter gracilis]|uniref:ATP synthase subunit b n=1 Tax=Roseiterribacter gracilis TaxID=2812848 RepID=A0A8S8XCL5_9PROT|nr:ATP synthase subunit b 1 [Rhodospirillales bacterium TMPK1]
MLLSFLITAAHAAPVSEGKAEAHLPWYLEHEAFVLLAFVILIAIAFKPAKKGLLGALDARIARIRAELDEAERLRAEAAAMSKDAAAKYEAAVRDAAAIVAAAKDEAQRLRAKAEKDLAETIARRETQATDRIGQAEAQAIAEVRGRAVDVAVAAARDLATDALQGPAASRVIDKTIDELGKSAA